MKYFLFWLGFKLRTDNNALCAVMWVFLVAWLIFNLFIFGLGSPAGFGRARSFLAEARNSGAGEPFFGWLWGWLRFLSWWGWIFWVPATIIYTPWAFRDEFQRARASWSARRAERGSPTPSTPSGSAPAAPSASQRPLTFRDFLKWEFIADFGAIIASRIFGGRR